MDDASDEDYDPECDPDDVLDDDPEESPRTVRTAVQRETLGPVVGSGPDIGGSAKNNTDKPKEVEEEVDVDARSKRGGFEASIRRFVRAARVEAKEAASSHTADQDDTETVSGQVNVEAIDDDAELIVERNSTEGKTSSLDANSNTQQPMRKTTTKSLHNQVLKKNQHTHRKRGHTQIAYPESGEGPAAKKSRVSSSPVSKTIARCQSIHKPTRRTKTW
ncbi:hypothetical protein PC128_g19795 [Phytophthora cactorum]|nr:hypothetical protein PC128_g19795 [Phytophthora cactorum]